MAVIQDYVLPSGVRIIVHDDYMAPRGSEEEKRVIEAQRRAAYEILMNEARRQAHEGTATLQSPAATAPLARGAYGR